MSRILLTTVSDDRFGRKEGGYKKTQDKIRALVQNDLSFMGIEIRQWDFTALQETAFYKANKTLLDNIDPARNGRAYKPFVIYEALQNVGFGDYVIYNDCSPELWEFDSRFLDVSKTLFDANVLRGLIDQNNDILTCFVKWDTRSPITNGLGIHTHANFTTERCINRMGMQAHKYDYQHASGFIGIRKTEATIEFVREWLHWNTIDECACMGRVSVPDNYEFWDEEEHKKMGHRHDQSISGLLLNKRGAMLVDMPKSIGINPFNFLNYCRLGTDYQFISSNNTNVPGPNEILKGSTVENENGVLLRVFKFQYQDGQEWIVVGKHPGSLYRTKREHLKLIHQ